MTTYETKDFNECCLHLGLPDLNSVDCFYTWSNNTIWSKLDRAMVNSPWLLADFFAQANFFPPGCLSDHYACIISLFNQECDKKIPF